MIYNLNLVSVLFHLALQLLLGFIYQKLSAWGETHFNCRGLYELLFPWGFLLLIHCIVLIVPVRPLAPIVCDLTILTYDAYQKNAPSWKKKLLLVFIVCFLLYSLSL